VTVVPDDAILPVAAVEEPVAGPAALPVSTSWRRRVAIAVAAVGLLVLPLVVKDRYFQHVLVLSGISVLLAASFDLLCGYTGLLNLGHAAFFGVGAYASALVAMHGGISPWLTLPVGGLVASVFGVMLGLPSFRLRGPYLAIVTISFSEIIRMVAANWVDLTRGALGLYDIPPLTPVRLGGLTVEFTSERSAYYVVLVLAVATVLLLRRLLRSEFGLTLESMREDEAGAEAIGINTTQYKLTVFIIASFVAGFAGAFYAHYVRLVSPEMMSGGETSSIITMVLVGGLGTPMGPVVGGVLVTFLSEGLRFVKDLWDVDVRLVLYGLILMLTILFMREGVVGMVRNVARRRRTGGGAR
jgi:branched-chain amino acid transport system permease protein